MNASTHQLESVFNRLLSLNLQAAMLFVLVALLIWAFGKKLEPRWHHTLWAIVFIRLLLPVAPESAFSLFNFWPVSGLATGVDELAKATIPGDAPETSTSVEAMAQTVVTKPDPAFSWRTIAALMWLIGVIGFVLHLSSRVICLNRRLKDRKDASESSRQLLAETLADLGMKPKIRLQETSAISSPAVIGVFRPSILIPSSLACEITKDELRHILLHELAHIRRRDVAVNWILTATQILHWINPFVWIASYRIREARENACDAWAILKLPCHHNRVYGRTLLKLLEIQPAAPVGLTPQLEAFFSSRAGMERRIRLISSNTYGSKAWTWLAVSLIPLLIGAGLTDAQNDAPPKKSSTALQATDSTAAETAEGEPVAATVNGQAILQSEVQKAAAGALRVFILKNGKSISGDDHEKKRQELEEEALNNLIRRQLILQEFERLGGVIKPEYVDQAVDRIIQERFGGDRVKFQKELEKQDMSLKQYENLQKDTIIIQAMRAQHSGRGSIAERQKAVDAWLKILGEKASIRIPDPE